ncbi:MAG: preprotein translocase, SecY subunit [Clostridia bacterium]|nr:preprotein translocase, SecY subunit [Clostridia bacterium]
MTILETLKNAWKVADIKQKILYTLFIIVLFRIGTSIPVPFIDSAAIANFFNPATGANTGENLLGYLNMLSGNALAQGTVFALTIQPYINASIIIQLLTIAIPYFEKLQKDGGDEGKKKLTQITRYTTVVIGLIQGFAYYTALKSSGALVSYGGFYDTLVMVAILLTLNAGSCLVMWLGESVNEKGIGNGISIILFASIVSRAPEFIMYLIYEIMSGRWYTIPAVLVLGIAMLAFIVFMDNAERRIPIQYAKRQVGRKMYGGQNTHLPIKVAMTGVMPIIFTFAIVSLPATIAAFIPDSGFAIFIQNYFSQKSPVYMVLTFALIIAFNYFYIAIQYNPIEIANNIKNNGGTIPGIRPGKPTSDFIIRSLNRVTLFGALFLGVIAILPFVFGIIFPASSGIALGGTSILIIVSVALETVKQLESQMLMRHYKGFLE